MAGAPTLNVADLEAAVSSAVQRAKSQKFALGSAIKEPLIAGRYIRAAEALDADAHSDLKTAAETVSKQVNAKNPGLNTSPLVETLPGHIILGIIFREE